MALRLFGVQPYQLGRYTLRDLEWLTDETNKRIRAANQAAAEAGQRAAHRR